MVKLNLVERQDILQRMRQQYISVGKDTSRLETELRGIRHKLATGNTQLKDYIL